MKSIPKTTYSSSDQLILANYFRLSDLVRNTQKEAQMNYWTPNEYFKMLKLSYVLLWHINPSNYVCDKVISSYIKRPLQMLYLFHLKIVEEIHVLWITYKEWETSKEEVSCRNRIPVLRISCCYRASDWSLILSFFSFYALWVCIFIHIFTVTNCMWVLL